MVALHLKTLTLVNTEHDVSPWICCGVGQPVFNVQLFVSAEVHIDRYIFYMKFNLP